LYEEEPQVIHRKIGLVVLVTLAVSLAGCGTGGPNLAPVTGKVNYKGAPVAEATVVFVSKSGVSAAGTTDASGVFTLATGPDIGAAVGDYQVSVRKKEKREIVADGQGSSQTSSGPPMPGGSEMAKMMQGKSIPEPKDLLPIKYADHTTSGLTATVTGDKSKDNFTFDLVD
jgi:predicted small lipoprotein YifL